MNVLIVDDDAMVRLVLRQVLQHHFKASTLEAETGLAALGVLEAVRVDLVVLDMHMPFMDGLATLARIRANDRLADLPVVMLTAERKDEKVQRSIQLGVRDYLTKPLKSSQMVDRLGGVLRDIVAKTSAPPDPHRLPRPFAAWHVKPQP